MLVEPLPRRLLLSATPELVTVKADITSATGNYVGVLDGESYSATIPTQLLEDDVFDLVDDNGGMRIADALPSNDAGYYFDQVGNILGTDAIRRLEDAIDDELGDLTDDIPFFDYDFDDLLGDIDIDYTKFSDTSARLTLGFDTPFDLFSADVTIDYNLTSPTTGTVFLESDAVSDRLFANFEVLGLANLPADGAAELVGTTLFVNGSADSDTLDISANGEAVFVQLNGQPIGSFDRLGINVLEISGGDGDDTITLGDAVPASIINGKAGHDVINAGAGNDQIFGGSGNDYIFGNDGNDIIFGEAGRDTLTGGAGKNVLFGGSDADRLNGSGGRDALFGQEDGDRLYGNGGNDTLDGGGGVDRLFAGSGDDLLIGGGSNDKLYAQAGNDTLIGNAGRDLMNGGPGDDTAFLDDENDPSLIDEVENIL
ncbi:MAG: calcium-binding protein [Planctomycetota bacterium]